ncbi:MAG: 2-(1,2-epoxy,2-dihydrophenyl)acetyl-CoA isomerase [Thermoplasmata archaeon]|jgi:2-(1,2-epoxy-1,2-dihydrophenyl)acetyl-CoA isomerase|nr:2-(1,2-epoxy,2-dihydrophenyl)acetyl-CoA isomerase [Thermoplasmata archaeon]
MAPGAAAATASAHDLLHIRNEEGGVAVATFTKAETMNSLDPKTMWHVRHTMLGLLEDQRVRAIVLTGSGKAFCAGANVKEMQQAAANGRGTQWVLDTTAELHPLLLELHSSAKPVIAAVNGAAAGGGLGLALVADCRIGSPDARFAAGYFGIGLSPDGGSTWLLPRLIGEQRTRRFFFGNEVIAAEEARSLGLLDEVVPADRLVARAVEVARTWGAWSTRSREGTKRLLESQSTASFADQLETERGLIAAAAGTADFQEGTTAFTEKRKARFA